ncbi:hypothetical protein F5146DRAFT_1004282 [Armillaria mellea]|nr:hypothetical protein F5146DRAFT_1004282 [Armillaria mellea]
MTRDWSAMGVEAQSHQWQWRGKVQEVQLIHHHRQQLTYVNIVCQILGLTARQVLTIPPSDIGGPGNGSGSGEYQHFMVVQEQNDHHAASYHLTQQSQPQMPNSVYARRNRKVDRNGVVWSPGCGDVDMLALGMLILSITWLLVNSHPDRTWKFKFCHEIQSHTHDFHHHQDKVAFTGFLLLVDLSESENFVGIQGRDVHLSRPASGSSPENKNLFCNISPEDFVSHLYSITALACRENMNRR